MLIDPSNPKAKVPTFDVIVVGAGIQGAGVAQAMAAAGYNTALVEQAKQPALQTSSQSSKLIHGGLRYLETGQIGLVRECLRERRILTKIAPSLVHMRSFFIPVYAGHKRAPLWIWLGLQLYRLFGGGPFQRHSLNKAKMLGLKVDNLRALFEYQDAQTDDRQLTCAVVNSAKHLGCTTFFNFNVTTVERQQEGYLLSSDAGQRLMAPCIINATGAFINRFAALHSQWPQIAIELIQGSHLILNLPAPEGCIYTESPDDGRAVFILPWKGKLMVGTTELGRDNPNNNFVTDAERNYLLRVVASILSNIDINKIEIVEEFSGLRVLPSQGQSNNATLTDEGTRTPYISALARDTRLISQLNNNHQYIAIYGGKLTAYRATAGKVVTLLKPFLPGAEHGQNTAEIVLN
jgi:glycerol-3-phosphate dehydrogenase